MKHMNKVDFADLSGTIPSVAKSNHELYPNHKIVLWSVYWKK